MPESRAELAERIYGRHTRPGEEPQLRAAAEKAAAAIAARFRPAIPSVTVSYIGAINLFPSTLAFWVITATDVQRDALLADRPRFEAELRAIVAACGYPAESLPRVGFTAQSEETVTRDYAGNWFHAMK